MLCPVVIDQFLCLFPFTYSSLWPPETKGLCKISALEAHTLPVNLLCQWQAQGRVTVPTSDNPTRALLSLLHAAKAERYLVEFCCSIEF